MPNLKQMSKANLLSLDSQSYGSNSARGTQKREAKRRRNHCEAKQRAQGDSTDILLTKMEGGRWRG